MQSSETNASILDEQSRTLVLGQLGRILGSSAFGRSARRRAILSHIVHLSLQERSGEINGASIAAEIYGRTENFDPAQDAIVRVEVSRLRTSLDAYYASEGWNSPVRISIPKGAYVPVFVFAGKPPDVTPPGEPHPVPAPQATRVSLPDSPARIGLWLAAAALLAIVAAAFRFQPRPGGDIQRITHMPGQQAQPSVSPDGTHVAFVWDGERDREDIFVTGLNGQDLRRLTDGPEPNVSPAWSPDGRYIAFMRRIAPASRAIYVVPSDAPTGSSERLLTTIHTAVSGIDWTPDSKYLIVPDSPPGVPLSLYLVSLATADRRLLVDGLNSFQPAISHDGRTLAFLSDQEHDPLTGLYLQPLTAGYLPLGHPKLVRQALAKGINFPRWSFDGRSIFYTRPQGVTVRYSLATGNADPVLGLPHPIGTPREYAPGKFLFARLGTHAFIGRVEAGDSHRSIPTPQFQTVDEDSGPDLAPDGSKLAFTSTRSGHPGLWTAQPDGTAATPIASPVTPILPRWSPDSKQICFFGTLPDGHSRIFLATPGGGSRLLQLDGADNQFPVFSRDGRRLYFSSNRNGKYQIWRASVSGGPAEQMTEDPSLYADESVDGKYLFYTTQGKVWRMSLQNRSRQLLEDYSISNFLRATADGLYVESVVAERGSVVHFSPFSSAGAPLVFRPSLRVQGWYPIPGENALVMGVVHGETHLEIGTLH